MSRWISRNLSLFAISLLLAFFFWAVATEAEDPTRVDTFGNPVPVELRGLREGLITYGAEDTTVRVEIRAPKSVWDRLRAEDIEAYVDLTDVETGTIEVPVHAVVSLQPADVIQITPPTLDLTIEPTAEREVPVRVATKGTPAIGFGADTPEVIPQVVRVTGPESFVATVTEALVTVAVDDRQTSVRGDYQPAPVDENGDTVPYVEVTPRSVTVNVPIVQLEYIRDIPVTAGPLVGQPAPGYRITNLEFDPPTVKVSGRREIVQSVNFLQTEPITLEGITETLMSRVNLQMVQGLTVIEPPSPQVTVTVTIEIIRSGVTLEITPTIQGLGIGFSASVGSGSVVVILSGPLAVMEALQPSDVQVILDLTGLTPGDYIIEPLVVVPKQVDVENVIPEAVPVHVEPRVKESTNFR